MNYMDMFRDLYRQTAQINKINGYNVDTRYTSCHGFETTIWLDNYPMVVVEYYKDGKDAVYGHTKWIEFCTHNPESVYSAQTGRIESLKGKY